MAIQSSEAYRRYRRYFVDLNRFYRKKKVRVYTGIVFSILTVAFFLFFAIRPTLTTIVGLWKEIENKKIIVNKLEDKINALNSAQLEYQRVEKNLHFLDEALPVSVDLSLLIRQLEALARKNNVTINSLQFEATTLKGEATTEKVTKSEKEKKEGVSFNLGVSGDYSQLKSFLNDLIRLRRLILVNDFAFQTSPKEEKLSLSLNAKAHYFIE